MILPTDTYAYTSVRLTILCKLTMQVHKNWVQLTRMSRRVKCATVLSTAALQFSSFVMSPGTTMICSRDEREKQVSCKLSSVTSHTSNTLKVGLSHHAYVRVRVLDVFGAERFGLLEARHAAREERELCTVAREKFGDRAPYTRARTYQRSQYL